MFVFELYILALILEMVLGPESILRFFVEKNFLYHSFLINVKHLFSMVPSVVKTGSSNS